MSDVPARSGATIYVTHCSGEKDDSLKGTGRAVAPDELYTSSRFRRFVRACREVGAAWAVVSDRWGVWFPDERREWYESESEFRALVGSFDSRLAGFDRIYFYHEPGRHHPLYRRVAQASRLRARVEFFTEISEVR